MTGLRAELAVADTDACPVAAVSTGVDGPVRNVEWTGGTDTVERFAVRESVPEVPSASDGVESTAPDEAGSAAPDGPESASGESRPTTDAPSFREVFSDGDERVVEFDRDWNGCVCEAIEAAGCPVESVEARDGELTVTVHARSRDRLKTVIAAAREAAGEVRLNYVVTGDGRAAADPVVVDRGSLTDRQREAIATAYELGYFEHPRAANAERVAEELGIAPPTFREHLAAAQSKLLGSVVE